MNKEYCVLAASSDEECLYSLMNTFRGCPWENKLFVKVGHTSQLLLPIENWKEAEEAQQSVIITNAEGFVSGWEACLERK